MSDSVGDVLVVDVEAWDEASGEGGVLCDGGGWVGVAQEVGVNPGVFPLGGWSFFLVREPSLVPAVDAVLLVLAGLASCLRWRSLRLCVGYG